ncbi:hypothetical protein LTR86_002168 [Recurvomyces mirabilis]|nr:hypothetical protein LTR86_002168 [Recurvomyces mirabilis]
MACLLLSLPLELRYMIYECTFPPRHILAPRTHSLARKDFLSLLQTCRQVHGEAAEAYYGTGTFRITVSGTLDPDLRIRGTVGVQGMTVPYQKLPSIQIFAPFCHVKHLRICVQAPSHERAICEAQTVMFALVKRLAICHALRTLEIGIDTATPPAGRNAIKPQYLSPDRVVRFLIEPIRHLGTQDFEQLLRLSITGEEGQPLEGMTLPILLEGQQQHSARLLDAWVRYFFVLKQLLQMLACVMPLRLADRFSSAESEKFLQHQGNARICGDVLMLEVWHPVVVTRARSIAGSMYSRDKGQSDVRARKQKLLERMGALEAALRDVVEAALVDREANVLAGDLDVDCEGGDEESDRLREGKSWPRRRPASF